MVIRTGPISRAVTKAIKATSTTEGDAANIALAKQYAALIDAAAPLATYRKHLDALRQFVELASPQTQEHLQKIEDALSAHSVASDLGPKLLAALTALGMTPASRGAKGGTPNVAPVKTKLDELRERRERRARASVRAN